MASSSCAYVGVVRHRRFEPVAHELRMRLFMLLLDLDELPALFDGFGVASARGRALAEFRRSDYLGEGRAPLADEVRALVASHSGRTPSGPIRVLTSLRQFGYAFNPVSFYYCFEPAADRVEAIAVEVTNTPWGERHAYVLLPDAARAGGSVMCGGFAKAFHVSPFMGMDHTYSWRMSEPGERLSCHISSHRRQRLVFDATLSLRRCALTPASMRRLLAAYPLQPQRTVARIYAEGLRVWAKGAEYHPNPSGAAAFGPLRARLARAVQSRRMQEKDQT